MRVAIAFAFAILCHGQAEDSIARARELVNAGNLSEAAQELTALLNRPEAATYGPILTATAYSNLGTVLHDMGRPLDAERAYRKACDLLDPLVSDQVGRVLWFRTKNNLASMYLETDQPGKAERIIESLREFDIPEGEDRNRFRGTQASLLMVRGRGRDAEKLFESVLEYWQQHGNMVESAVVLNNLGVLALRRGEARTGLVKLGQALDVWKKAIGPNHPAVLSAAANYGYALLQAGRKDQAADVIESSLAVSRKVHGEATPITAHLTALYAAALRATGRDKEASRMKAEADRMSSALSATDPARHTVDVLDLVPKR